MGKPPALPGDSQSLTVPGIATSLHSVNRSQGHGKETDRERQPNPKPYEVGMQISCGVYPQRAAQSALRATARRLGRGVPGAGPPEGEQGGGGASPDHVHMLLSIPPKYAVSQVVGYLKGKSAIHLARVYGERKRNFVGEQFWARGYFVNTVGRDEEAIRTYIRNQEEEDQRLEQLNLWR